MDTGPPADNDLDEQVARLQSLAAHAARQAEINIAENMEIARQQAQQLSKYQVQTLRQEQAQQAARAALLIQQVHQEAKGAIHRAKQERSRMEAEELKTKQTNQTTKHKIKDEEIRRRNQQHEHTKPDRSKKAKSGPSPEKMSHRRRD